MAAKFFIVLCASLALVNTIAACPCGPTIGGCGGLGVGYNAIGGCGGLGVGYNAIGGCGGLGAGYNAIGGCGGLGYNAVAVDNGGALGVTSSSALAPSGITILSENAIDGFVEVVGAAPLLAAVAFEGNVPSAGSAGTSYSCGNGNIGISAESLAAAGLGAGAGAYGPGRIGLGAVNAANFAGVNYGAANLGAAIAGAEIAGINAGLAAGGWNGAGCGCGNIYY